MLSRGAAWVLETAGEPLRRREREWGGPDAGLALLEVLACGVCHTDLGYADGAVAPRMALPLVLGHEIVGRVLAVGGDVENVAPGCVVLAPAVSPCRRCRACERGRPTSCAKGRMPGNDADGGFATHTFVPAHDLVVLAPDVASARALGAHGLPAWQLAPLADAATTAEQAIVRARLARSDVAIFVGAGGVGGFGAQLAKARGAHVIAIDRDPARLETLAPLVDEVIVADGLPPRKMRGQVRARIDQRGWGDSVVRVFETSGARAGQELAFELLARGGTLSIVGYTPETVDLRLSNVMALDAEVLGNWGCDPALYPAVVDAALRGALTITPFVERFALSQVNEVLEGMRSHTLRRRAVLVPDALDETPLAGRSSR